MTTDKKDQAPVASLAAARVVAAAKAKITASFRQRYEALAPSKQGTPDLDDVVRAIVLRTWGGGVIGPKDFRDYSMPHIRALFKELERLGELQRNTENDYTRPEDAGGK